MAVDISVETCLCLERVAELDNLFDSQHGLFKNPAIEGIRDELGRFRVWCANLGAHRKGRISLDHRLRYSERIRKSIINLLEELRDLLATALAISSGQKVPLDEAEFSESESSEGEQEHRSDCASSAYDDRTELEHISLDLREVITCLYDLAITINRSGARNILSKASNIDVTHFLAWDVNHVKQKFPAASLKLQTRMGESNSKRRQIFRYLNQHHSKFAYRLDQNLDTAREDQASSSKGSRYGEQPGARDPPAHPISEAKSRTEPLTLNTQTTVATFYDDDIDTLDDRMSDTTSAASDGFDVDSVLQIPDPPPAGSQGRAFECPFCFDVLKISSIRSWRLHVLRDLRPYSCTFDGCTEPVELFATRHAWYEHERLHRRAWTCTTCHKKHDQRFELQQHIRQEHAEEDEETAQDLAGDLAGRATPPQTTVQCPLCLQAVGDFRSHVSKHLRTLALFVLPPVVEGAEEEVESANAIASESGHASSDSEVDDEVPASLTAPAANIDRPLEGKEIGQGSGPWADFNLQGKQGLPPLFQAAGQGNLESIRLLIEDAGVDPRLVDSRGQSALSKAAEGGHVAIVKYLLTRKGVFADQQDSVFHRTELSWAASGGHVEVVKVLLDHGADSNAADNYGRTALWRAASAGHLNVVNALLDYGADMDRADRYGRTPFFCAVAGGHAHIVSLLASRGAHTHSVDRETGQTALIRAAAAGNAEVVRVLLRPPMPADRLGLFVNEQDNAGQTALSKAAENGHSEVISLLARCPGIDLAMPDRNGKTPLEWARSNQGGNTRGSWRCCRCLQAGRTTTIPHSWEAPCPLCRHERGTDPCKCDEPS